MKTLILYLSVTGNTEKLAHQIANQIKDVAFLPIQLKTKIPESEFWKVIKIGFLMWLGKGISYSIPHVEIDAFEQVIVGTPVWMGKTALPVIDVVNKLKISNRIIGIFATCGAEPGNVFVDFQEKTSSAPISNHLAVSMSEQSKVDVLKSRIFDFAKGTSNNNA